MSSIAIVANGQFPRREYPLYLLEKADRIICCDGALASLVKRGISPDVVVGDLDSVSPSVLRSFKGTVVRDPDQETNDLTKAIKYILKNFPDVSAISILGASGKSEAHTIANYSLLMQYERDFGFGARGIELQMVSDYSTAFSIGDSCELFLGKGRRISIFSPDSTLRIKSEGLEWETDGVVFDNWWKASLNSCCEDRIKLQLNHPAMVLIILD